MLDYIVFRERDQQVVFQSLKYQVKSPGNEILPQHLPQPVVPMLIQILVEDTQVPHLGVKHLGREICTPEYLCERLPVGTHYVSEPGVLVGVRHLASLGQGNDQDQPRDPVYY